MCPLIIPSFNQLTYLRGLVEWWQDHAPGEPCYILDQHSEYLPLLAWYAEAVRLPNVRVMFCGTNKPRENLAQFLTTLPAEAKFYCISDPDIMPCEDTPREFLQIFNSAIVDHKFHHAGFCLKIDDIPDYPENAGCMSHKPWLLSNETPAWKAPVPIRFNGRTITGYKFPIDTTFAMYRRADGWTHPMNVRAWDNSMRILTARHLPWYIDPKNITDEMRFYFQSCQKAKPGASSLANNYRPKEFS